MARSRCPRTSPTSSRGAPRRTDGLDHSPVARSPDCRLVPGGTDAGEGMNGSALPARPGVGRSYAGHRAVRLGDVTPKGRLRLDALARYLQDVANDDATEGIGEDAMAWVVRSTTVEVHAFP